jgi:hypothetical protein
MTARVSSTAMTPAAPPSWGQLGLSPSAQRLVSSAWIRSRDAGLRRLRRAVRPGR